MGLRFRKSFKIAPGIKFNVNKKSIGFTFGKAWMLISLLIQKVNAQLL